MSDVPELDRLLEEHEIFKTNMGWYLRECRMRWFVRFVLACGFTVVMVGIFGLVGLFSFFLVWGVLCRIVPPPEFFDPFVRYRRE